MLQYGFEKNNDHFTCSVAGVDRSRPPLEIFRGITSHIQYLEENVLASMPVGVGEEIKLYFFLIGKEMAPRRYATEMKRLLLYPDPVAQAVFNQKNPEFSDRFPNSTQWSDANGFCSAIWHRWGESRNVSVGRDNDHNYNDKWYICGVRR